MISVLRSAFVAVMILSLSACCMSHRGRCCSKGAASSCGSCPHAAGKECGAKECDGKCGAGKCGGGNSCGQKE